MYLRFAKPRIRRRREMSVAAVSDPYQQIGVGEYTFSYGIRTHGLVIKVRDGLVSNWREYEHESELSWSEIIGDNQF